MEMFENLSLTRVCVVRKKSASGVGSSPLCLLHKYLQVFLSGLVRLQLQVRIEEVSGRDTTCKPLGTACLALKPLYKCLFKRPWKRRECCLQRNGLALEVGTPLLEGCVRCPVGQEEGRVVKQRMLLPCREQPGFHSSNCTLGNAPAKKTKMTDYKNWKGLKSLKQCKGKKIDEPAREWAYRFLSKQTSES